MKTQQYIDGAWRDGDGDFAVTDPATGDDIARFAASSEQDCLDAVDAAERALPAWRAASPRERADVLRRAFEILTAEAETLATLIVRENGKSWADAAGEAAYATEFFRWFSEEAVRIPGDYRLSPAGDKRIIVTHQPIGVSLLITPWNFPAAMATRKLAPALAAGCTTVLKPALETPLTAAYIVDALTRAGIPRGVVNLVTPRDPGPATEAMLARRAVRKLSFTGSTPVGRTLLRQAADRVISCSMELGGNAPLLVLPGADIEQAVEGSFAAKMRNGGSACTAANRFYVHTDIHDEFVAAYRTRLSQVTSGPGSDRDNVLGALVTMKERDKVAGLVDRAVDAGAALELGGETPEGSGAFYPATLLTSVTHGSEITENEIFGPVTTIVRVASTDEAVRMANDTEFGLMAYVFGEEREAIGAAQRIEAGMVAVNRGVASDPAAPFGGMKQSGLGREGSAEGILEFLEEQYITIDA
jgi:succinate-semialdehyde dehydrogenase/glutarate-semialdehyde dehydrogenase